MGTKPVDSRDVPIEARRPTRDLLESFELFPFIIMFAFDGVTGNLEMVMVMGPFEQPYSEITI